MATKFDPRLKEVVLYTDGSCLKNLCGAGGVAAIVRFGEHYKTVQEGFRSTTNNRMEMLAAIRGLDLLNQKCNVTIYTDSQYLINGISLWIKGWKKRGWKLANGERVKMWISGRSWMLRYPVIVSVGVGLKVMMETQTMSCAT